MKTMLPMPAHWHTAWHGADIVVWRDDVEVDRFAAESIRRVICVPADDRRHAIDIAFSVVEVDDDVVVLPAETGFSGRVHFERLSFWAAKACIYWAERASAHLPPACCERRGLAWLKRAPRFARLPRGECEAWLQAWSLSGPQTWDQRRWQRIEGNRPLAGLSSSEPRR